MTVRGCVRGRVCKMSRSRRDVTRDVDRIFDVRVLLCFCCQVVLFAIPSLCYSYALQTQMHNM